MTPPNDPEPTSSKEEIAQALYSKTSIVTQDLQRDIVQFLSAKHTANATLSVAEVMKFYDCPEDRARRVVRNLVSEGVLAQVAPDTYKVTI